jgi:hypothetical protein
MTLLAEVEMTRRHLVNTINLFDQILYGDKEQNALAPKIDAAIAQAIISLQRLQAARRGGYHHAHG